MPWTKGVSIPKELRAIGSGAELCREYPDASMRADQRNWSIGVRSQCRYPAAATRRIARQRGRVATHVDDPLASRCDLADLGRRAGVRRIEHHGGVGCKFLAHSGIRRDRASPRRCARRAAAFAARRSAATAAASPSNASTRTLRARAKVSVPLPAYSSATRALARSASAGSSASTAATMAVSPARDACRNAPGGGATVRRRAPSLLGEAGTRSPASRVPPPRRYAECRARGRRR